MAKPENYYDDDKLFHKKNRDQAHDPKAHTKHWCTGCDAEVVSSGEKCPVCGNKDTTRNKITRK